MFRNLSWRAKTWLAMLILITLAFLVGLWLGWALGTESNWVVIG